MTARDKWVQEQKIIQVMRLEKEKRQARKMKDYRLVWVLETKINRLKNEIKL
jgi:hypothetical protein